MAEGEGNCNLCFSPGNFQCGRCSDVYCSLKCLKDDWPRHRYVCIAFPGLLPRAKSMVNDDSPINSSPINASPAKDEVPEKTSDSTPVKPISVSEVFVEPETSNETKPKQSSVETKIPEVSDLTKNLRLSAEKDLGAPKSSVVPENLKTPANPEKKAKDLEEVKPAETEKSDKIKEISENQLKAPKAEVKADENKENQQKNHEVQRTNVLRDRFSNYNSASRQTSKPREQSEDSYKPTDTQRTVIQRKPFETIWKEYLPIFNNGVDYFKAIVLNVDGKNQDSKIVYVMCQSYEIEFEEFSKELTYLYKSQNPIEFSKISVGMLVLTPLTGNFVYRAEVIGKSNALKEVRLRLIDRGNELILKNCEVLKVSPRSAFAQKRFAFQVEIENLDDNVKEDDVIEIKMNVTKIGEVSQAIMKIDDRFKKPTKEKCKKPEPVEEEKRIMLDDIDIINLPQKIKFAAKVTDLSLFIDRKMVSLFENNEKNLKIYDEIQMNTPEYCEDDCELGYSPVVNEMVLARFDNLYCRGIVVGVGVNEYEIQFIDYGNFGKVSAKEVRKLPLNLALPICAHTCVVRNFNGFLTEETKAVLEAEEIWVKEVKVDRQKECFSIEIDGLD